MSHHISSRFAILSIYSKLVAIGSRFSGDDGADFAGILFVKTAWKVESQP